MMGYINKSFFILLSLTILFGCTGSDGDVNSGGQDPDPVVVDFPIAYIKRPIPTQMENGNTVPVVENLREPIAFNPGAALFVRDRATQSAQEENITDKAFTENNETPAEGEDRPLYDVKDVEVSYDGKKLVFAMRAPEIENADEDEQPTWNIWEYNQETKTLRRVISSNITAEAGQDVAPVYLPDGRIVFSSTRQRKAKAILLDEGKPQFSAFEEDGNVEALSLHVMSEEGTEIKQITFNQSHDLDPTVLNNGKIVFSRWDNAPGNNTINLYQVNPDGSDLEILYGRHSHNTGTDAQTVEFLGARQVEDGRLMVALKEDMSAKVGSEFAYINWSNFTDINQASTNADTTLASQESATPREVRTDDVPSLGGRFASIYPLYDKTGRLLISWTPCRLNQTGTNNQPLKVNCDETKLADSNAVESPPLYGIWMYDPVKNNQLPIVLGKEDVIAHEIVALAPRDLPVNILPIAPTAKEELLNGNLGIVHIKSVYDLDGSDTSGIGLAAMADPLQSDASNHPVRFIRVVKPVSLPDEDLVDLDGTAFGRSRAQGMRDILGYARVEPDGSAMFTVPADVAFSISLVDANGRRVGARHQNWLTVAAGEVKQCNGCHERTSELPHGRIGAQAASINTGAPATGSPFPNTTPALFADQGETMAQVYNRLNGFQKLSVDIKFQDVWTVDTQRTPDPSFEYSFNDLQTPAPTSVSCITSWTGRCRITINYVNSIQPIWDLPRIVNDNMGNQIQNNTCTTCHGRADAMDQLQVPAAQLELSGTDSTDEPDHLTSYRELFFPDNEVEIVNGALIDRLVPAVDANGNPIYETDADGNLVLDANGNPVPVMTTVNLGSPMNVNSANANNRFFSRFDAGGTHAGWLTDAEKKLIAEWIAIGAQYYNNPFAVPQ